MAGPLRIRVARAFVRTGEQEMLEETYVETLVLGIGKPPDCKTDGPPVFFQQAAEEAVKAPILSFRGSRFVEQIGINSDQLRCHRPPRILSFSDFPCIFRQPCAQLCVSKYADDVVCESFRS